MHIIYGKLIAADVTLVDRVEYENLPDDGKIVAGTQCRSHIFGKILSYFITWRLQRRDAEFLSWSFLSNDAEADICQQINKIVLVAFRDAEQRFGIHTSIENYVQVNIKVMISDNAACSQIVTQLPPSCEKEWEPIAQRIKAEGNKEVVL